MEGQIKTIIIIVAGVVIVLAGDYIVQELRAPATCGVATAYLLPDKCAGACPLGTAPPCAATAVGPYGWGGALGTQATACACAIPPAPGTTGGI